MTAHKAHIFPVVNHWKNHIIRKARIKAIGYANRKIVVVIIDETTLFEVWVAKGSFVEVRQLDSSQLVINLIGFKSQDTLQRSGDICCRSNH